MMQQTQPDDFVLATGIGHSVQELVETAFHAAGISNWQDHIEVSEELVRPPEKHPPIGNPAKAERMLGWKPRISFHDLIGRMVSADIQRLLNS